MKKKDSLLKSFLTTALVITSIPAMALSLLRDVGAVEKESNYTQYVDPFVSTEVDYGQLFPGSVVPNGLVKLSPDTYPHKTLDHAGYDYKKLEIQGFSHTRIEGVGGQGAGGDVLVTPTYVQYTKRPEAETRAMKYEKKTEEAKPGYYKAELTPKTGTDKKVNDDALMGKIVAEMTTDERTGYHKYTFPKAGNVNIMADLNYTYHGTDIRNAILDVIEESEDKTVLGGRMSGRNVGGSGKYTLYFYMETSKATKNVKTWNGTTLSDRVSQKGNDLGAILNFDVEDNEAIELKVSISPISVEQAKIDMNNEIKDWNFNAAYQRADKKWNDVLSKIRIETSEKSDPTGELKKLFYTHLYHMFMTPVNATSTTGIYRGTDGNIHEAKDYTHYDSWTLWDDYRKYPMIGLVMPDVYKDMVRSIADALEHGIVTWSHDKQPVPNVRTEHAVALLADGVAKGFIDIDNLEVAYEEAKKIANKVITPDVEKVGYVENRVDRTIEYAYDDWALSLIAEALGKQDEADYFLERSFNYKNMYRKDAVDSPFSDKKLGLLWNRDKNGNWLNQDPTSMSTGLYQGSMWQYTWYGSNDVNGMMDLMGGKESMLEALSYLFGEHDPNNGKAMQHNAANEVELHAPYLFNFAGRPDKTQYWVRQIYTGETWNTGYASGAVKEKMYKLSPKGYLETMDDDAGTMAMMFVSAAMGIFPMTPGDTTFQIGSPFFEKVSLDVGNGKTFTIVSNNVSPDNMYIQSAKLNGKSFDRTWVDYSEITRGGTLIFEMGDQPSSWASHGVPAKSSSDNADTSLYDEDEIAYSTAMLSESKLNDGSIDEKLIITLKTAEFSGATNEDLVATGKIKVSNVPKGLIASARLIEKNKVEVSLKGKAENHKLDNSIGDLNIEITDKATNIKIDDSIRKNKDNIKVMFTDDRLSYSTTKLQESQNDDGTIINTTTVTLTGDASFSGKVNEDFTTTKKVTFTNVPEGLTPQMKKIDDKTVVLSFEGKAKSHDIDVDFEVAFKDEAFVGALASQVENSSTGGMTALVLDFHYDKTTDLKKSISKAKLYQQKTYTKTSFDALQTAIQNGEKVLSSKNLDGQNMIKAMSEIDAALEQLKLPTDGLKRLEAEKSDNWSGGELKNESINLGGTYDGAWIQYSGLDFNNLKADTINIRYVSNSGRCASDARIDIKLDSVDGETVGTAELKNNGSDWNAYSVISVALTKPELMKGIHDVYFVMSGTTTEAKPFIANIDYLQFSEGIPAKENNDKVKLEGEKSNSWSGGSLKNESVNLGGTYSDAWVAYDNVQFGTTGVNTVNIKYSTRNDACATDSYVEIRKNDKDGIKVGEVRLPLTADWKDWQIATANLDTMLTGTEKLCFVLKGTTDSARKYIANIDYMEFENKAIVSHIEAEDRTAWSGGELKTENPKDNNGIGLVNVGGTRDNSWLRYDNIKFDGTGKTEMQIRYSHNPGTAGTNSRVDIYLDDMNGTPVGSIPLPTTNGWANYTITSTMFDKEISGTHTVYLKLHTDGGKWVANIDWFKLQKYVEVMTVDKSELQKVYDNHLSELKASLRYDRIGFEHFKGAMNDAMDIIDDNKATEYQVKTSQKYIQNAFEVLQFRIMFDLSDLIVDMETIKQDNYTKDSYEKLTEAISKARSLAINSSYDIYKSAYDNLVNAHSLLTTVNKMALELTITKAEQIDLSLYIQKGQDEFKLSLQKAKDVLSMTSLTQKEVDDAMKSLDTAMSRLIMKGEKAELKKVIERAETIDKKVYTSETIKVLQDALQNAKTVFNNENATQDEINQATTNLDDALKQLKRIDGKPIDPTYPNEKPGDSNNGGNVQTEDKTSIVMLSVVTVIFGGLCLFMRKKEEF